MPNRKPAAIIALIVSIAVSLIACQSSEDVAQRNSNENVLPVMTVHKSPTCGCCAAWVDYLRDDGFIVEVNDSDDMNSIKYKLGLNEPSLMSCHTATIAGYVIEGHVPAADIRRLLAEKPSVLGLTAPGMPQDSPGMNSIEPKNYDVLSFNKDGDTEVFSSY